MPIANNFTKNILEDTYRFGMDTSFCSICSLFQLNEQPIPGLMFHDHYPFFTGLSSSMKKHFGEMVEFHTDSITKSSEDLFVVEIGSNDGTLLEFVKNKNIRHLGIDPSPNVVEASWLKGVTAEIGFFGREFAADVSKRHGKADIIFAANVICHIPDMLDFASGISELISDEGQFIFEEPYIGSMLEKTSYDQIYDEHVYIFGALSVRNIFARAGLELVDAIPQETHGGSMRYVLMKSGKGVVSRELEIILKGELSLKLDKAEPYLEFGKRCEIRKLEFKALLVELKKQGKRVAGYAATSKSTTILNYSGVGNDLIEYISDSTPEKQGTVTPGTHIPVISHEQMRINPPDYLILFAWNHEKEILAKETELTDKGLKWIRFVPKVEILD
jgi:methylation protein EvaC